MVQTIPLYDRDGSVTSYALVDDDDHQDLARFRWFMNRHSETLQYAHRSVKDALGRWYPVSMHRQILDLPTPSDGRDVDHINGNGLDNQRSNLRIVTHAQNLQNQRASRTARSSFRGVYWHKHSKTWIAQVRVNGKKHQRRCRSEEEAAEVASQLRSELMPFSVEGR